MTVGAFQLPSYSLLTPQLAGTPLQDTRLASLGSEANIPPCSLANHYTYFISKKRRAKKGLSSARIHHCCQSRNISEASPYCHCTCFSLKVPFLSGAPATPSYPISHSSFVNSGRRSSSTITTMGAVESIDGTRPSAMPHVNPKGCFLPVPDEQPQCILVLPLQSTCVFAGDGDEGTEPSWMHQPWAAEFVNELLSSAAQFVTHSLHIALVPPQVQSSGDVRANPEDVVAVLRHIYCSTAVTFFPGPAAGQGEKGNHLPLNVQVLLPCDTLCYEGSPLLARDIHTILIPTSDSVSLRGHLSNNNADLGTLHSNVSEARRSTGLPPLHTHSFKLPKLAATPSTGGGGGKGAGLSQHAGLVVGGTFDRLHAGHKLLLASALAVLVRGGSLVVGLATGPLLERKVLAELVQSYERRSAEVEAFLRAAAGPDGRDLSLSIVPVAEVAPARGATDGTLKCIVVSQETEGGAAALNAAREKNGLPALEVLTIQTVDFPSDAGLKRLSSTELRLGSLGTLLTRSEEGVEKRRKRGPLSSVPFVLGVTGGIASGKSTVREMLLALGAEGIDADLLGHRSYVPGTPTYKALVAAFGPSVVSPSGEVDRRALGGIVFGDKGAMDTLTGIVWPAIGRLVEEELTWMGQRGVRVCVAEAAVLLEAGWECQTDEVWVVFVSRQIAKQRLMDRNQLSEAEADKRLNSQMSIEERTARADVLICNAWQREDTQKQVARAWEMLTQRAGEAAAGSRSQPGGALWVRWAALMERLGVAEDVAVRWWDVVRTHYDAPERSYHRLQHLEAIFASYHEYAHFIADPDAVQLAIFFHDAIYNSTATDKGSNERESAQLFCQFAAHAGNAAVPPAMVSTVEGYIHRTIDHMEGEPAMGDLAWFLDFDLAILGSEEEEYARYAAGIREEYKHVEEEVYCKKRAEILQRMLDSPHIFSTPTLQSKLEVAAQRNLKGEISRLLNRNG